jgi:hypothetical protein
MDPDLPAMDSMSIPARQWQWPWPWREGVGWVRGVGGTVRGREKAASTKGVEKG